MQQCIKINFVFI